MTNSTENAATQASLYHIEFFEKPSKAAKDQTPKRVVLDENCPLPTRSAVEAVQKAKCFRHSLKLKNSFFLILEEPHTLPPAEFGPKPGSKVLDCRTPEPSSQPRSVAYDSRTPDTGIDRKVQGLYG